MKLLISKNKCYKIIFILTILADAYCFVTIGNRNITVFYPLLIIFFLVALVNQSDIVHGIKINPFAFLMIIYMPVNYIFNNGKISTLLISEILWIFYIFSYRKVTLSAFEKTINTYHTVMNIMAIYGIYQFIAHYMGLPFSDLRIPGHMSLGYNWGNDISIGTLIFKRSNAVFREPSFYSQFLSINILIYIQKMFDHPGKRNQKDVIWIILNACAIIISFSGTGILMLLGGLLCVVLFSEKSNLVKYIKSHIILMLLLIIMLVIIFLTPNPLRSYFFERFNEFDSSNIESISAYIRFIKPYEATYEILKESPFIGLGLGNSYNYMTISAGNLNNSLSIALPRSFAELGIIGGFLYIAFMVKGINKNNMRFGIYKSVLFGTYLMTFMHGTWSSEIYWIFLGLLNIKIVDDRNGIIV